MLVDAVASIVKRGKRKRQDFHQMGIGAAKEEERVALRLVIGTWHPLKVVYRDEEKYQVL